MPSIISDLRYLMRVNVQVSVLGCNGGIGAGLKTTCLAVDESILIDAGTGLEQLTLEAMLLIDQVFITHAHMDHIACLPLMVASTYGQRTEPLVVYASVAAQEVLRTHIFNWQVWPDYTQLPTPEQPVLRFLDFDIGDKVVIDGKQIEALPVSHTVPAQGYLLTAAGGESLAFSGDTGACADFWRRLGRESALRHVLVDVSFPDAEAALATVSGHYAPGALAADLERFSLRPSLGIVHLKPGYETRVMAELFAALASQFTLQRITNGQRLVLE